MQVIRAQGYSGTTVDDICSAAGLTKGAFFHHFKSKEDLALAAAKHFSQMAERLFATAPYRELADPLDRLLGYVDFRAAILARVERIEREGMRIAVEDSMAKGYPPELRTDTARFAAFRATAVA